MTQAVIFDCWGTLFRNKGMNPYKRLTQELGYDLSNYEFAKTLEKDFMLERHESYEEPLRKLLEDLEIEYSEDTLKKLEKTFVKESSEVEAFPDAIEVLEDLRKKYRLGLVSNTDYLTFQKLRRKFNLSEKFDEILTSYQAGVLKPDPKIFEMILDRLEVEKEEAVMVGDFLPDDVKAAQDYGIEGILVNRKEKHPNYPKRVQSLEELEKYL